VTKEEKALVIYRSGRSRETFDEAELLFDAGYLNLIQKAINQPG